MKIEDIADYCEVMECSVVLGDPEAGFIGVDGSGYQKRDNYSRFLMLNELSALPSPRKVVDKATVFRVNLPSGTLSMSRDEFERELRKFREKAGA